MPFITHAGRQGPVPRAAFSCEREGLGAPPKGPLDAGARARLGWRGRRRCRAGAVAQHHYRAGALSWSRPSFAIERRIARESGKYWVAFAVDNRILRPDPDEETGFLPMYFDASPVLVPADGGPFSAATNPPKYETRAAVFTTSK